MPTPPLRLACCLCGRPIPTRSDVYALDAEWQRRFPTMNGILSCSTCCVSTNYWHCRTSTDTFVPGHRPAAPGHGRPAAEDDDGSGDIDSWSHIESWGTPIAMVFSYPDSAVRQGAEQWLRSTLDRPRLHPDTAQRIRAALAGRTSPAMR